MIDIKDCKNFTPQAALLASKNGRLKEWTINYLETAGNNQELADIYKTVEVSWSIKRFPLKELKRATGPEKGMAYYEAPEIWEKRVKELVEKIKQGTQLPPLIVSNTPNTDAVGLSDGNHRHEALLRFGIEQYYCIFTIVKK